MSRKFKSARLPGERPRLFEYPEWMERGLCRGRVGPAGEGDLWFERDYDQRLSVAEQPPREDGVHRAIREKTAKGWCAQCPVQFQCLELGLALPEQGGIWGGTDEEERREIRRLRKNERERQRTADRRSA